MLLELRVENYAVIDHAVATFGPGLNLLSGETGAGKSLLVDALALVLGGKASSGVVREGTDRAVIGCVFESTSAVEQTLDDNGIDSDGGQIILRREVHRTQKGRIFINNQPATAALLRQLAPDLALIHSQGETLGSFDRAQQLLLLDRFALIDLSGVSSAYDLWRTTCARLKELQNEEGNQARQAELWRFALDEIDNAHIAPPENGKAEDETLEAEKRLLTNAEKLYRSAMNAYDLLYENAQSAEASLRAAQRHLEELSQFDSALVGALDELSAARATVEDVGSTMRDYASRIHASPERLAEIEDRLALLDRLKRKYGPTLAEIAAYRDESAGKLERLENREELLKNLSADLDRAVANYRTAAARLTAERRKAAVELSKHVAAHIADLALDAEFAISVTEREPEEFWTAHGWDAVEYRIATNAGEPLKPLGEIASGGEMSRVMLALKLSVEEGADRGKSRTKTASKTLQGEEAASKSAPPRAHAKNGASLEAQQAWNLPGKHSSAPRTLVFDEIDIGIGGRAAEAVGKKLRALARTQQVLCVTHLPQIAAFANRHLLVEKQEDRGRTKTSIRLLTDQGRTEEIARMISGARVTETSLRHAEQMLKSSQTTK